MTSIEVKFDPLEVSRDPCKVTRVFATFDGHASTGGRWPGHCLVCGGGLLPVADIEAKVKHWAIPDVLGADRLRYSDGGAGRR